MRASFSMQAKELVALLLETDPAKRLSASQVLEHPWLHGPQAKVELTLSKSKQGSLAMIQSEYHKQVCDIVCQPSSQLQADGT